MRNKPPGVPGRSKRVLFSYGFRPFFLLAGIYAVAPIATAYWAFATGNWPEHAMPIFVWHGHEMLFGFVAAAIAGFLLTAVATWTNTKPVSGIRLIALVGIWLAGRVASWPWVQYSGVATSVLSVAFFPALAVVVAIPLVRANNTRNLPFLLLLAVLFVAELMFQARRLGWPGVAAIDGLRLTVDVLTLMIVVAAGRIIPAFTRNALAALGRNSRIKSYRALDIASVVSVAGVLIGDLIAPAPHHRLPDIWRRRALCCCFCGYRAGAAITAWRSRCCGSCTSDACGSWLHWP